MAKLQHIDAAKDGDKEIPVGVIPEFLSNELPPAITQEPEPQEQWVIFKLVDSNKRGGVYIPHIDDVVNPETKTVERMRLLAGVESIWLKDQKHVTDDYAEQNARGLEFPRGIKILRINVKDKAALEFARRTNCNIKAPDRVRGSKFQFFEYDPAAAEKEALELEMLEVDMVIEAKQMDAVKLKKIASFVKIPLHNDVGDMKTDEGIRMEIIRYAKRNPKIFKKLISSQSTEVDIAFAVRRSILNNQIDVSTYPGRAVWAAGGPIGVIPKGSDAVKILTELCLTNSEEGRAFKEHLKTLM